MKRLLSVGTVLVVVAIGCSSSSDSGGNTSHTGGAAGAPSGAGGSAHAGGTVSTGGGNSSGGAANSGGTGAVSTGGNSPSAGRGGTGAGGTASGGTTSAGATNGGAPASGGATTVDSGTSDGSSDAGNPNLCGSTPCTATRCAGVGCGPAVCCEGPNGPVCIHGATACPAADGGVRTEKLACTGGGRSADFARSCSRDPECFVAQHWAGCCHIDAVGLNVTERAAFTSFETSCGGAPACGCCCDRIVTESGMTVASGTTISVRCADGMCTTSSP